MTLCSSAHQRFAGPTPKAPNRLSPLTIGFWLSGGLLGPGGCILGVCMPYHHPVAVVISVLWWGIYLGCLGASVGALIVLLTEPAPVSCSVPQEERVDCYDHKPGKEHRPVSMDEQAENQSILVIPPSAFRE
jgi:hypothetical protein